MSLTSSAIVSVYSYFCFYFYRKWFIFTLFFPCQFSHCSMICILLLSLFYCIFTPDDWDWAKSSFLNSQLSFSVYPQAKATPWKEKFKLFHAGFLGCNLTVRHFYSLPSRFPCCSLFFFVPRFPSFILVVSIFHCCKYFFFVLS